MTTTRARFDVTSDRSGWKAQVIGWGRFPIECEHFHRTESAAAACAHRMVRDGKARGREATR